MKTNWRNAFLIVIGLVSIVITLLTTANSILNNRRAESGGGLMVREMLKESQQALESSLRSEVPDFPVERLISSPAYQQHVATVSAASKALESYHKSEEKKESVLSFLFIITTLTYVIAERLFKRWSATKPEETPKQAE